MKRSILNQAADSGHLRRTFFKKAVTVFSKQTNTHRIYRSFMFIAATFALAILLPNCQPPSTQPCEDGETSKIVESDFSYITSNTPIVCFNNTDESQAVANFIIRNESDYKKHLAAVQGDILPAIDFNRYVLLAGRTKTKHSDLILSQSVVEACGETIYRVRIGGGIGTAPSVVKYFALVPADSKNIGFEINLE